MLTSVCILTGIVVLHLSTKVTTGFKVCQKSQRIPGGEGRVDLAIVPFGNDSNATAASGFYAFGGGTHNVDRIEWDNNSLTTVSASLPRSRFNPSSVRRVAPDLYLAVPSVTDGYFFFWNATDNSIVNGSHFAAEGLEDYCLLYSVSRRTAVLSAGRNVSDDSLSSDWFTLDLSDTSPSALMAANWTQHSPLPFGTYSHSCCVLGGFPMVFGGWQEYAETVMEYPYKLDWETMQWSAVNWKKRKHKRYMKTKRKILREWALFRRTDAVCVTQSSNFWAKDSLTRAFIVGGRRMRGRTVLRLTWDAPSNTLRLEPGRNKRFNTILSVAKTETEHFGGAALLLYDKIFLMGGSNRKNEHVEKFERLDVDCRDNHKLRSPLKHSFCVPYYVLYPLGLVFSLVWWRFRKRVRHLNENPLYTSATAPTWRSSLASSTPNATDGIVRLEMCEQYEDAIMDTLTDDRRLPTKVAEVIYGYCDTLEFAQYGADSFAPQLLWLHTAAKALSWLLSFAVLIWYVVEFLSVSDFIAEYTTVTIAICLSFGSHPAVKFIAEVDFNRFSLKNCNQQLAFTLLCCFWVWGFFVCIVTIGLIPFGIAFIFLVVLCGCGTLVFAPFGAVFCVALFAFQEAIRFEMDHNVELRMRVSVICFILMATLRASIVSFLVWLTPMTWTKAFVYGVANGDCPNFQFDVNDWRAWVLLISWVL